MNELLTKRPDRPLPPETHARMRDQLLLDIEATAAVKGRRTLAPVLAAASVLAVVAGLAIGVRAFRTNGTPPVSGAVKQTVRALSAAETATLRTQCLAEANRITSKSLPHPFTGFKVLRAFEITGVKDPRVVNTWLIGSGVQTHPNRPEGLRPEREPRYWLCSRTAGGTISEPSIRFGTTARLSGAPFMRFARNAGVYTPTVARITVEPNGQPPVEAILRDGFWFAPTVGRTNWGPYDADDPGERDIVVRGYDANGTLLYTDNGPNPTAAPITCSYTQVTLPDGRVEPTPSPPVRPECREYHWPS